MGPAPWPATQAGAAGGPGGGWNQPPGGAPPQAAWGGPPPPKKSRGPIIALVTGVALLAVAALILGVLVIVRGDDTAAGEGEVFLELASESGPDPFTQSSATGPPPSVATTTTRPRSTTTGSTSTTVTTTSTTTAGGATTVNVSRGNQYGLYGGSLEQGVCDVERQIGFLQANPDIARAFAQVLGSTPADLPALLRSFTPLVLTRDTRVTNYGYRNGQATPRQAVLQAGTAVLVDRNGVPRVKCYCGNPLSPPVPSSRPPTYRNPPWPGFTPTGVVVVQPAPQPVTIFVTVNVTNINQVIVMVPGQPTGRALPPDIDLGTLTDEPTILVDRVCDLFPDLPECQGRTTSTTDGPVLGTGDVQVTLRWDSPADLDLAVTDPAGDRISYGNRSSPSGGQLDVDANGGCTNDAPVENVFWPSGQAPAGTYLIEVHYFGGCEGGTGPQAYTLEFRSNGALSALVPVVFDGTGNHEVQLLSVQVPAAGSASGPALDAAVWRSGGPTLRQAVSGTLSEGETASYKGDHVTGPNATTPPSAPAPPASPPSTSEGGSPPPTSGGGTPGGGTTEDAAGCAPTGVAVSLGAWPGGTSLTLPATVTWQAPSGCTVQEYRVAVTSNGSAAAARTVAAGTTSTRFDAWGDRNPITWTYQVVAIVGGVASPPGTASTTIDCSPYGSGSPGPEQVAYTLCMHEPSN